ncbi:MAG: polyprenyl synthetase family protein [Chloroflexi bacterium]|nr:polyprenyl synthetase family protein [Actinomycetota bacterium]MCL5108417.1 polyprenyl synthetase family protein [Chloroflexota bacterium]
MNAGALFVPVAEELAGLEVELERVAEVDDPIFAELLRHILRGRGKRLRPSLAFLTTGLISGDRARSTSSRHYPWADAGAASPRLPMDSDAGTLPLAVALELLHTATLVHDDLLDNAFVRRGNPTLNAIASQGVTVLVGDYLFAGAADYANRCHNLAVMDVVVKAAMTICKGEIRQIFSAGDYKQSMEQYYRQIDAKTAALFAAASECPGILAGQGAEVVARLREYGHSLGVAFQIVDDILDFTGDEKVLGKPVGSDLRQGTVTLPTLYALQSVAVSDRLLSLLEGDGDREANVSQAVQLVRQSPAIEDSYATAADFVRAAKESISIFPDSPYRRSLLALADYALRRER